MADHRGVEPAAWRGQSRPKQRRPDIRRTIWAWMPGMQARSLTGSCGMVLGSRAVLAAWRAGCLRPIFRDV